MSNFEDLQRQHADALVDLTAALDVAGGIEDVLQHLERAQQLETITHALDLDQGAAAALEAVGITDIQKPATKRRSHSTDREHNAPSDPASALEPPTTGEFDQDALFMSVDNSDGVTSEGSVDHAIAKLQELISVVNRSRRMMRTSPTSFSGMLRTLGQLKQGLRMRTLSRPEAEVLLSNVTAQSLPLLASRDERARYRGKEITRRLKSLTRVIETLFDTSDEFEHTSSDH